MAKDRSAGGKGAATSPDFPVVSPPQTLDQSFTLPTIMTMQSQLGAITEQLKHVEKKLDEISHDVKIQGKWVAFANGAVAIIVVIIAFLAPRLWDILMKTPAAPGVPGK